MEKESKTEHTPGPWIIRDRFPEGDFNAQILAPGKLSDGQTAIIVDQIMYRANAELIASAPDLKRENEELKGRIEALLLNHGLTKAKIEVAAKDQLIKELTEALAYIGDHTKLASLHPKVWNKIESALSKAKSK